MPRGTPESATRLTHGEKAGRGSFLRLAALTVGTSAGLEALTQLAPAQTAEAATDEQKNRREISSTRTALRQETVLTPTNPKKDLVAEDIIQGIPDDVLIIGGIIAVGAGIAAIARRRERRGSGQPSALKQMWRQEQAEQKRLEREALERQRRAIEDARRSEQQGRDQAARKQAQIAERKQLEISKGRQICTQLEPELRATPLAQFAEDIRRDIWKNNHHVRISLTKVSSPNVVLSEDGSQIVQLLSKVGWKVSYTFKDDGNFTNEDKFREHSLSFGIMYFGDRDYRYRIIPEAQGLVSDEDLQKGVKALFIRSSEGEPGDFDPDPSLSEWSVFPLAYPDYEKVFDTILFEKAKELSPNKFLPDAKDRMKRYYERERNSRRYPPSPPTPGRYWGQSG